MMTLPVQGPFASTFDAMSRVQPLRICGVVAGLRGLTLLVDDLPLPVGAMVSIRRPGDQNRNAPAEATLGEVVGFSREQSIVMLFGQAGGIRPGDIVVGEQHEQAAPVGKRMLGRIMDGLARPIDGKGPMHETMMAPISPEPFPALRRRRITQALHTGVRAIDLMTPIGKGQRMGVFAGPGVGKSTLMATIARRSEADVNVIALIGERGREVKDFVEHSLGPQGIAKSVLVVATGDESPLLRIRAAKLACSVAEHFRACGLDVMLMMDSVTRFAHAQRQIGLAVGEPPATKGYTPSVFANLSLLLERAGCIEPVARAAEDAASGGSITGLYTILVEADDMTEPVADASRGILDGHIILSRKLAQKAHYPAIDVLDSVSRVADDISDPEHISARKQVTRLMAMYREVEDLVQIGAYAKGSNPESDVAIDLNPRITELLRQGSTEATPFAAARMQLVKLAAEAAARRAPQKQARV
jgi:FliI/YscN family ATPase